MGNAAFTYGTAVLPSGSDADIYAVSRVFRSRLDGLNLQAQQQIAKRYDQIINRLAGDIFNLTDAIEARQAAGKPVPVSWLHKQQRYKTLILNARDEFERYGSEIGAQLDGFAKSGIQLAEQSAVSMLEARLPGAERLIGPFNRLPVNAIKQFESTLYHSPAHISPIRELFDSFGNIVAADIERTLSNGLARGLHPDQLAQSLTDRLGLMPQRANVIVRTELYRSYREANRGVYEANSDVVDAWIWHAHLGANTCAACFAMHGKEFPTNEPMGSHPNCRCTMVPKTKSWEELGFDHIPETRTTGRDLPDGEDALNAMPELQQKAAFGNVKLWRGWKDGEYKLEDVVRVTNTERWGVTRTIHGYDAAKQNAIDRIRRERALTPGTPESKALKASERSKRTWHGKTRERIAQGVGNEADVREVGSMIRKELEKSAPKLTNKERNELLKGINESISEESELSRKLRDAESFEASKEHYKALVNVKERRKQLEAKLFNEGNPYDPDKVTAALKQVRPGYGEGTFTDAHFAPGSHTAAKDRIRTTADRLPKEWVDSFAGTPMRTKNISRGFFRERSGFVEVNLSGPEYDATAIHELGHYAERARNLTRFEKEFYDRRTAGEPLQRLSTLRPGHSYARDEVTRPDQFFDPYVGKSYAHTAYEIVSMGTEALLGRPSRYSLANDPDMADFILGILAAL